MTRETLTSFEELAVKILQRSDAQQKELGLRNLIQKIRQADTNIFDIAERCCDPSKRNTFDYNAYSTEKHNRDIRYNYYIEEEATRHFDTYDNDTTEEHQEREKLYERNGQFADTKYKVVKRTITVGVIYSIDEETKFNEEWPYSYHGYYTYWRSQHNSDRYKLLRTLSGKYATTEGLKTAYLTFCLVQALTNENRKLRDELELCGMPILSAPPQTGTPAPTAAPTGEPIDDKKQTKEQPTGQTVAILTDKQQKALNTLMPFFETLSNTLITIKGKKGEKPILVCGNVGSWHFCTKTLGGYVGKKIASYVDGEGHAFIAALTGGKNTDYITASSSSQFPNGADEVDDIFDNFENELKKQKQKK